MNESAMQHGLDWTPDTDPTGWLASEKFNGCRAYWDGKTLWSRGGIAIQPPAAWLAALPKGVALDGELYAGPQGLSRAVGAVRYGRFAPDMTYQVFDLGQGAPGAGEPWEDRIARTWDYAGDLIRPVSWARVTGENHLRRHFLAVTNRGGEGLMLRHPAISTDPGRTALLLKVKYPFQFRSEA